MDGDTMTLHGKLVEVIRQYLEDLEFLGKGKVIEDLADALLSHLEIDVDAVHDLLLEQFDAEVNDVLRENIAAALSKQAKDLWRIK